MVRLVTRLLAVSLLMPGTAMGAPSHAADVDQSAASARYRVPKAGDGALRLRSLTTGYTLARSDDPDAWVYNAISPVALTVPLRGPAHGAAIKRVRITVTRLGCFSNCHAVTKRVAGPRLNAAGRGSVKVRIGVWGCAQPRLRVRLIMRGNTPGATARWAPETVCGE